MKSSEIVKRKNALIKEREALRLKHEKEKMIMQHEFKLLYLDCGHPNMKSGKDMTGYSECWCNDCGYQG